MLYPIILKLIQFLSETPSISFKDRSKTKITSEFPKNLFVSILLILFLIILLSLFVQLTIITINSLLQGELPFTKESMPYLLSYCLVNLLFLAHLCLYFGYNEEISISTDKVQIKHGYFSYNQLITLNKEQLLFSSIKENFIGNQHLELHYLQENEDMNKVILGTYLLEEQIETISLLLNRLSF
ncbi:MAG: hypothetical protein COB02_05815 [Candidatus Cloacimonadota bacterium]|nr:MAG: hypothetical protein COB02_05815 [Candidatus Cloacimonadota bacterium]